MKIKELTEATYDNINILKIMADYIVKHSKPVPYGRVWYLNISDISQSNEFNEVANDILSINKDMQPVIDKFQNLKLIYNNDPEYSDVYYGKTKVAGYYNMYRNIIAIYFNKNMRNQSEAEMAYYGDNYRTLVHELRHMVQFTMFNDFSFKDQAQETGWSEKKIEWDATFHDILDHMGANKEDVFSLEEISGLADEVVVNMNNIMLGTPPHINLPDKVAKHYYKKALKFYLDQRRLYLDKKWQKYLQVYNKENIKFNTLQDFQDDMMHFINIPLTQNEKNYFKQKSIADYRKLKASQSK